MMASHERTSTTLRAWSMPVTIGIVTHRLASRRLKPGSTPTTAPPARAAPRDAASITPVRPPQRSRAPARAMAVPTRSALRAVAREQTPSPTTPMCRAMRGSDGITEPRHATSSAGDRAAARHRFSVDVAGRVRTSPRPGERCILSGAGPTGRARDEEAPMGMVILGSFVGEEDDSVYVWIRRFENEPERKRLDDAVYPSDYWKNEISPKVGTLIDREQIKVTRIVATPRSAIQ